MPQLHRPRPWRWFAPAARFAALFAALFAAPWAAQAQPGPRADPLDATAKVPPLVHQSSLASYRRMADDKSLSWRDANDTVARIGGWRVYAREAQQPDPAPAAKPAVAAPAAPPNQTAKPMPAGHGGHTTP